MFYIWSHSSQHTSYDGRGVVIVGESFWFFAHQTLWHVVTWVHTYKLFWTSQYIYGLEWIYSEFIPISSVGLLWIPQRHETPSGPLLNQERAMFMGLLTQSMSREEFHFEEVYQCLKTRTSAKNYSSLFSQCLKLWYPFDILVTQYSMSGIALTALTSQIPPYWKNFELARGRLFEVSLTPPAHTNSSLISALLTWM